MRDKISVKVRAPYKELTSDNIYEEVETTIDLRGHPSTLLIILSKTIADIIDEVVTEKGKWDAVNIVKNTIINNLKRLADNKKNKE